jgi:small subunit ribosomal protein S6
MATPANTYELTYIVNAVLSDNQIREVVGRISRFIEENGSEVLVNDEWGTRRLAYPIRKKRNGYFVNMHFRGPGSIIPRLERALEIDDDILRYLTLRLDAKMLRHFEQQQRDASAHLRAREAEALKAAAESEEEDD